MVATGVLPFSALDLSPEAMQGLSLAAWGLVTAIVTMGVASLVVVLKDRHPERTKVE